MKRLLWSALLFSAFFSGLKLCAQPQLPKVPVHTYLLANGLEVLMAADPASPVVAVQVWYHVGSKDERPGMAGFAHLFEHLMFDGTKTIPPGGFSNYIIGTGGIDNAYTTEDATVFWETIPDSALPLALWLESDRMRNLSITQSTFNNERAVVEEEMRQRFTNQPYGGVVRSLYETAFTVSPYRHRPIGSKRDLDSARLDEVKSFYDTYYVPENATLVLSGGFDRHQAEAWVQRYFGPLKESGDPIIRKYAQDPPQTGKRTVALHEDVALPAFVEGYHIPAASRSG